MNSYTTEDGEGIQMSCHTWKANWFQRLWYRLTWRIDFWTPRGKLQEDNLCTLEELLKKKD